MREILFRGKTDNGEWVEGLLYSDIQTNFSNYGHPYLILHKGSFRLYLPGDDWNFKCNAILVLKETVGQFTGLTDKNGKRIFEGDIVTITGKTYSVEKPVVVTWGSKSHGWSLKCPINDMWVKIKYYALPASHNIEVIGNIHENPDLL